MCSLCVACRSSPDPAGPRLYTPSDTYMLVHQEDSVHDVATDPGAYRPVAVKSFTPNAGSVSYTATSTNRLQRVGYVFPQEKKYILYIFLRLKSFWVLFQINLI